MALINCPECTKQFSDKAAACPNCAYSLSFEDKIALNCDIDWRTILRQRENLALVAEHCPDNELAGEAFNFMGLNCFNQGEYQDALKFYQLAFDKGSAKAASNTGVYYYNVEKNYEVALRWFEAAIEKGFRDGVTYNFAGMAYIDSGDYAKAIEYFTAAAELGLDSAQFNLGSLYYSGRGTPVDLGKARYWIEKSAAQYNEHAIKLLPKIQETQIQNSKTTQSTSNIPITQAAQSKNRNLRILAILGIFGAVGLFIIGILFADISFAWMFLLMMSAVLLGIGCFLQLDRIKKQEREQSTSEFLSKKSGEAFDANCAETLPEFGVFAIDISRGKWAYGTSGRVYPLSLLNDIMIEYEVRGKKRYGKKSGHWPIVGRNGVGNVRGSNIFNIR